MTQHGRIGHFRYVPDGIAVRYDRRIDATPADVWTALTEPATLARWLGHVAVSDRDVTLLLAPAAPEATGRITYCDPRKMLEVELQWPDEPPVRLVAEVAELAATRAVVVVEYRGLPAEAAAERAAAWQLRMDALAEVAAGGPAPRRPLEPGPDLVAAYEVELAELRRQNG
jgi:uncharacterized protein YndB with AHSA1/START domain